MLLKAGIGWRPGYVGRAKVDAGPGSQAGYTLETGHPVIVGDLSTEQRFLVPALLKEHQALSGITVIIPGKERPYGILGVHSRIRQTYSGQDANFMQNLANLFALVADRQRIETELYTTRNEQSIIAEGIMEGVTIQGQDAQILYANDIAAKLTNFPDAEAMRNTTISELSKMFEYFDENGAPFPQERLPGRRVLKGEKGVSKIIRSRFIPTGQERWLMIRATAVHDALNRPLVAVNIFQDITALKQSEADQRFLAEIGDMLANSLDYQTVLSNIPGMVVKGFADWCAIHLLEADGSIRQLEAAHTNSNKDALILKLQKKYPPDLNSGEWFYWNIRNAEAKLFEEISDSFLKELAQDSEHLRLLRSLEIRRAMILPMVARGHILGAITLVWTKSKHPFNNREIHLGKELAHRAAMAIDNIRLYQEANSLNVALEEKVAQRTKMLEHMNANLHAEIAERKMVEKKLERSTAMFSDLFDLSPDAIFLVNPQGKILQTNAQVEMIFGYDRAELVGKSIDLLLPEYLRAGHIEHRTEYNAAPQRRHVGAGLQLHGRRKTGDQFPVDVMLSPIKIENELLMISSVRDITEQKRIQAELDEVQHRLIDSQEAERLMLAQELHDGIIQELFSITFQLSEIKKDLLENGEEALGEKIHASSELAQQVIQGLRNISRELRPPALAPFGLEQAIYSHMERFQEMHPMLSVQMELTPDGQLLDESLRLVLFRIYQQAVSNVIRHAQAENLRVQLDLNDQQVVLVIEDDGQGFEVPTHWIEMARQGHLGLVGTRERVEAIGGQLKIVSKPGEGTRIRVVVPINPK